MKNKSEESECEYSFKTLAGVVRRVRTEEEMDAPGGRL